MKKIIKFIIIALLAVTVLGYVYYSYEKTVFYNCTEAKLKGYYNIPKESKLYRKSLDRDNDGVSCEVDYE